MAPYEKMILDRLLDSYEKSLLSRGENKIAVHVSFPITKKTMPEYFNESSLAYEDIHACVRELERRGFVEVIWKKGKEGHIIQKVQLNEKRVQEVYRHLGRIPRKTYEEENLRLLKEWEGKARMSAAGRFAEYLSGRIREGKSVKEYIELPDIERTREILEAVSAIERNEEECYIREFSVRHLGDTKKLESMLGVIGKILSRFGEGFSGMDADEILAERSIYHAPNYVYFKGRGKLAAGKMDCGGMVIDLSLLKQGIGLSGEDLKAVKMQDLSEVKKVITIENLTTFFRWAQEDSLMIYLGGYHNSLRRSLLNMVHEKLPEAQYLHFGDIDVGGFEIYENLCKKTGISFRPYHMGIRELREYRAYTKKLTENDRKRLERLLEKMRGTDCTYLDVLEYMQEHGVKLEQECVIK